MAGRYVHGEYLWCVTCNETKTCSLRAKGTICYIGNVY
jgi:hypothetical protein